MITVRDETCVRVQCAIIFSTCAMHQDLSVKNRTSRYFNSRVWTTCHFDSRSWTTRAPSIQNERQLLPYLVKSLANVSEATSFLEKKKIKKKSKVNKKTQCLYLKTESYIFSTEGLVLDFVEQPTSFTRIIKTKTNHWLGRLFHHQDYQQVVGNQLERLAAHSQTFCFKSPQSLQSVQDKQFCSTKGGVRLGIFSCTLSRNFVATQVARCETSVLTC